MAHNATSSMPEEDSTTTRKTGEKVAQLLEGEMRART